MLSIGHCQKINWGDNLHRFGVAGDGSCFFHSILFLLDSNYHNATPQSRFNAINLFRTDVANKLTVSDFMELSSNGTPLYKDLPSNVSRYTKNEYKLPQEEVKRIKEEIDCLVEKKIIDRFTPEEFTTFFRNYLSFREYILDTRNWVGDELHPLISKLLDFDIYIINNEEGDKGSFFHNPEIAYKNRNSIILYNLNNSHWEPIARFNGNQIQTIFSPADEDIVSLRQSCVDNWDKLSK